MNPLKFFTLTAAYALFAATPALAMDHEHHPRGEAAEPTSADEPLTNPEQPEARTIKLTVTKDGFMPDTLTVKKGEPLDLVVTRKVKRTCATEIVIKDLGIKADLPLDKPVTLHLKPTKSGPIRYACGMDMVAGVLMVE